MAKVKAIPEEYHTLNPYIYLRNASQAIEFYKKAFGAKERMRMPGPDGTIGHAELDFGDSVLMLADAPDRSPQALGDTTCGFVFYVEDVDAAFKRAVDAGAKVKLPVEDKFYG